MNGSLKMKAKLMVLKAAIIPLLVIISVYLCCRIPFYSIISNSVFGSVNVQLAAKNKENTSIAVYT